MWYYLNRYIFKNVYLSGMSLHSLCYEPPPPKNNKKTKQTMPLKIAKTWNSTIKLIMLEPRGLALRVFCWANCTGFPHASVDFAYKITSYSPLWTLRRLLSCYLGTPRICFHWNTIYRYFANLNTTCWTFALFWRFYSAYTWTSVMNWASSEFTIWIS